MTRLELCFHGCRVVVRSEDAAVCEKLACDFSYYRAGGAGAGPAIDILAERAEPAFEAVRGRPLFRHFNGDVHGWGDQRWVRYDDALVFYDARRNQGRVTSADEHLLYHYTYYLVIAKVGEALDRRGLHRFHSLGISIDGQAALFPMPVSGGKTTLALALLEDTDVRLYSEDTPLIDARGRVHPFAVRLSLREAQAARFPAEHLRPKRDPVFGDKYLVDLTFYGHHRVCAEPGRGPIVLWGRKSGQEQPAVEPMGSLRSLYLLLVFVILGKDCPQRAEVFVRVSARGLWMMGTMFLRRSLAAIQLWRGSRAYWFNMTPDIARNAAFVKTLLRDRKPHSGAARQTPA